MLGPPTAVPLSGTSPRISDVHRCGLANLNFLNERYHQWISADQLTGGSLTCDDDGSVSESGGACGDTRLTTVTEPSGCSESATERVCAVHNMSDDWTNHMTSLGLMNSPQLSYDW